MHILNTSNSLTGKYYGNNSIYDTKFFDINLN